MALADAWSPHPPLSLAATLSLAALLTQAAPDALHRQTADLVARGYRSVKLKVGRESVQADAERTAAVWHAAGAQPDFSLRLDANRAWTPEQATDFARRMDRAGVRLAFVEEPSDPASALALAEAGLPVAFDETLRDFAPETFPFWDIARALVLKPTILGGYAAAQAWAEAARSRGVAAVVSGCFESGVGHRSAALLGLQTGQAAGLDTYRFLARDVLERPLPLGEPSVPASALRLLVDERRLERID
jgi:O-succinylbenzoate synthase